MHTPPRHGERACYLRGCRHPQCTNAHYRYMTRYRYDRAHGHHRRVDSTAAANHIRQLLHAGWNQTQIAEAAGCARHAISNLTYGEHPTISAATARGVLNVPIGNPPPPRQYTNATGTMRRIRALVAMGHPIKDIATAIGRNPQAVARIARGELQKVRVPTAQATARVYRQWSRQAGPSQHARHNAAERTWHGPLAWDDIDNPHEKPDTTGALPPSSRPAKKRSPAADINTEVRHLAALGESAHFIARQLGRSEKRVQEILGRAA